MYQLSLRRGQALKRGETLQRASSPHNHQKDPSAPLVQPVQKIAQSDMHVTELSAQSMRGSSGLLQPKYPAGASQFLDISRRGQRAKPRGTGENDECLSSNDERIPK